MDLYCYHAAHGNFGDDLNFWFWDEILPGWRQAWPETVLIGVGTLINEGLPRGKPKLIIGSGAGYGSVPDDALLAECRIEALRGPRSAALLGQPAEKGIIDPAIMLSDFAEFRDLPRGGRPIFVPHEASVHRNNWAKLCHQAGVDYVCPGDDAKVVIRRLASAPLVIAESMHAAIIADSFGTPWHAVSISHRFNGEKWLDWADSLGIDLKISELYPVMGRIARMFPKKAGKPAVSRRGRLSDADTGLRPKGPARGQTLPLRLRIRMEIEALQTPAALRALVARPGQLSDREALARGKARYRAVIERLVAEMVG